MRVKIQNTHSFKWLKAFTQRLDELRMEAIKVFGYTDANIRIERIKAHSNKHHELFDMEYSDFQNEKSYLIRIRIDEFPLKKNKHNIY